MALKPITGSPLEGRANDRGKTLTVTDSGGDTVIQAALGKAAEPSEAVFETAEGKWRIERERRSGVTVLDASGNTVATARKGEVTLVPSETLPWVQRFLPAHSLRLGGDLWVARGRWLSRRSFRAELSQALLAREDRSLVAGIASILTQRALDSRRRFGGPWGG